MKLTSIAFIPNLTNKLVSMGALLRDGMLARASTANISFYRKNELVIAFKPRNIGDTIYVIYSQPLLARNTVLTLGMLDYDTLHHCLGHPLCDVLKHAWKHTKKCLLVEIPIKDSICCGCAEGKMPLQTHPLDI